MTDTKISLPGLASRWAVGMGLVTWRYLWSTIPLHRSEEEAEESAGPPPLSDEVDRRDLLAVTDGVGALFRRVFRVRIVDARLDARSLLRVLHEDMERFVPVEVVRLRDFAGDEGRLRVNDDFVVDMPGPWNGPVRVVHLDPTRLRLATRRGHLEAGQIEFRAQNAGPELVFEIEAWARPSGRASHLLYSRLRLAKEIQLNMWVRFCQSASRIAQGRIADGIEIRTFRCSSTDGRSAARAGASSA